jgi:hypothetical protein
LPDDLSGYLWRPVLSGLWRQNELGDGTYDFLDLVAVNRMLNIQDENRWRAQEAQRAKR